MIFHNIYINAFPREKSWKIKECGHRVSSHLGVHKTACLFVPYLYGPWGKRTASHGPQRTLCDFDTALQQKRLQRIACSRAAAHPVGPWGQECFHKWERVIIICAFFAIVPLPEHLGQAPVRERGLQKAKRSMVAQKNISKILGIHQAILQTQG